MNLYDACKRQSQNLSGRMCCQLSVAMACIGNQDILILDEPTTGLNLISWSQVGMAFFIGYWKNYVAFVSLSLPLLSPCVGRCGR